MLIRLGEIIEDAREYREITRAELADYAGISMEVVEEIEEEAWEEGPSRRAKEEFVSWVEFIRGCSLRIFGCIEVKDGGLRK